MSTSKKTKTKLKRDNSFGAAAKRLGADEDKTWFEAKLGKIAGAKSNPQKSH